MFEILFVLTVIFVAYVFFTIVNDEKISVKSAAPTIIAEERLAITPEDTPSTPSIPDKKRQNTTSKPNATTSKKPVANKPGSEKKGLKNPKTGEIATTYTNYRFTKRWIKDALVAEGLLEKVYKNDELNTETEAAIKAAIIKLEAIEQYKA